MSPLRGPSQKLLSRRKFRFQKGLLTHAVYGQTVVFCFASVYVSLFPSRYMITDTKLLMIMTRKLEN